MSQIFDIIADAYDEYITKTDAALKEGFKEFFERHPGIKTVMWTQHDYRWDDDGCSTGISEPYCSAIEYNEEVSYDDLEEDPVLGWENSFIDGLWKIKDTLIRLFEGDARVIVTRKGIFVEEYNDY